MQSDVSTIKDRVNIVDFVGEYVRLIKTGANHKSPCPFHDENTPSFIVTEERGTYHCFGCGKGGDVISFLMEIESITFREALQILADRVGVTLTKYTPQQQKAVDDRSRMQGAVEESVIFFQKQLFSPQPGSHGEKVRSYLKDRGITRETVQKFMLGYAPNDWHILEGHLATKGFDPVHSAAAGLLIQKDEGKGGYYDRFRGRLMFPIRDPLGRAVGYSARALPDVTGEDEAGAKYINTPESPLYHKSDILYGIDLAKQAIKKADKVLLVEGNMDVVACHEGGIEYVVGVSGTALTDQHIKILKRYTSNFVLFFDADSAGQKAARKSAQMCLMHDIQFSLIALTDGKDAADIVREDPQELVRVVGGADDALTYFIKNALQISSPDGEG